MKIYFRLGNETPTQAVHLAFAEIAAWHDRQAKEYADKSTGLARTVREQNEYLHKMKAHEDSAAFVRSLELAP